MTDTPDLFSSSDNLSEAERLVLELQNRATAFQNEQTEEAQLSFLTFYLADEWFAVPLDSVKVVSRLLDVTPVPGTSPYVIGVINYKSTIYPLIDLHQLLGLEPMMPTRASRIVILHHANHEFGVLVDSMTEVREVRESAMLNQVRSTVDTAGFINSEITLDSNNLLGVLSLANIVNEIANGQESLK